MYNNITLYLEKVGGVLMRYLKELSVETYRGILNLKIKNFGDYNIITGDNNTGKTSILEIIKGISYPLEINNWISTCRKRDGFFGAMTIFNTLNTIFSVNTEDKKIKLSFKDKDSDLHFVEINALDQTVIMTENEIEKIKFPSQQETSYDLLNDNDLINKNIEVKYLILNLILENSLKEKETKQEIIYEFTRKLIPTKDDIIRFCNVIYVSPFEHTHSTIYLKEVLDNHELYSEILDVLKEFDEDIININSYVESNNTIYTITSQKKNKALPLNIYGDGMKKALLLMSSIIKAKDGILLLDEFETSIHTSALNKVFKWVIKTCKKMNVQLFLTTHSEEAIDKFLNCADDDIDNIRVITLVKNGDKTTARSLIGSKALQIRNDYHMELR